MRKLVWLVAVLAALYAGYWFVGRSQIAARAEAALQQVDAGPLDLTYSDLSVVGFPSRFDTTLRDPALADPAAGWAWAAPWLQVFALSYRPNEVIVLFPEEQRIMVGTTELTLVSSDMRASARVRPNAALSFAEATFDIQTPRLRTSEGAELAIARLLLAARDAGGEANDYDIYAEATGVVLPEFIRLGLDPEGALPPLIRELRIDGAARFAAPLDRHGMAQGLPAIEAATLRDIAFTWGDIAIRASGEIAPDDQGRASGEIALSAANWEQALGLARAAGALNEGAVLTYSAMARNLDESPDDPTTLTVTLRLSDGVLSLGEYPIGAAPMLR